MRSRVLRGSGVAGAAAGLLALTLLATPHASGAFPGAAGLIVYSASGEIFVVAPTPGADPVQLTDDDTADTDPSWSADGTRIVFVSTREGGNQEIWVMDADGSDPQRLTNDARYDAEPVFSPDGTRIAFSRHDPDVNEFAVWTMEADGDNPEPTSLVQPEPGDPFPGRGTDEGPSWSPDGSKIAFASKRAGDFDIWVMDADGTDQRPVAIRSGTTEMRPDWAPDGSALVVAGGPAGVLRMALDGTVTVLEADSKAARPSWSPEGGRVVYSGAEGMTIVDEEGSQLVVLGLGGASPDWQPLPPPRPDLQFRKAGQLGWAGDDVYRFPKQQLEVKEDVGDTVSVSLRVQNDGRAPDGYLVDSSAGKRGYRVAYLHRGEPVTQQVLAGDFELGEVAPGARSDVLTLEVTLGKKAARGSSLELTVTVRPVDAAMPVDRVGVTVTRR